MEHTQRIVPYKTNSGLLIGSAYTPPAQQPTQEGEHIQSVLLGDRANVMERKWMMAYAVSVAAVFILLLVVIK